MSTADKLTYLNDTKGLIKDNINLGGGNLTTEPFRQYATTLKNIYKDFLANGIGTLWNNWEKVTGTGTSLNLSPTIQGEMEFTYKGNTSQNGTPTPTSPIPVNVVSGDNTIDIRGKNIIDLATYSSKDTIVTTSFTNNNLLVSTSSGTYGKVLYDVTNLFKANQGKKINIRYDSINLTSYTGTSSNTLIQIKRNSTNTTLLNAELTKTIYTIPSDITDSDVFQIAIFGSGANSGASSVTYNKLMFYFGEESASFEPYIGHSHHITLPSGMELCKIGTYEDYIRKSTGYNLFNPNDLVTGVFINTTTGEETTNSVWTQTKLIGIGNISSVTSSNSALADSAGRFEMSQYDENKNWIKSAQYGNTTSYVFTVNLEANTRYVRFGFRNDKGFTNIMLLEGAYTSETLPLYEPYGKVWYLHKEIGKVVLNGSESNWTTQTQTGFYRYGLTINDMNNVFSLANEILIKSTGFRGISFANRGSDTSETIYVVSNGQQHGFFVNTQFTTITNFKNYLGTNNTPCYYVLATPTNTPITDTTLINQLEESKLSYISQTNISQVNNDLPFNLVVKALKNI